MTQVDSFLEHYGKKGMKWGVRKRRSSSSEVSDAGKQLIKEVHVKDSGKGIKTRGGHGQKGSADAKAAAAEKQRIKNSGVKSLSDKELKALINRMNMEAQSRKLLSQESELSKSKGRKFVEDFVLNTARETIGKEVAKVVGSQLQKQMKKVVK